MAIAAQSWYAFGDLFDGTVHEASGFTEYHCREPFVQATLRALTGYVRYSGYVGDVAQRISRSDGDMPGRHSPYYPCLQLMLTGVDPATVGGLPTESESNVKLMRDKLVHFPGATFEFEAELLRQDKRYFSRAAVCVGLHLDRPPDGADRRLSEKRRQVHSASERGLIDDWLRDKAEFRLRNKPLMRKMVAMADSGYVPADETLIEVVFGYWHEADSGDYVLTPLIDSDGINHFEDVSVRFQHHDQRRPFAMTDLFRSDP
jgi:hypothetical protein